MELKWYQYTKNIDVEECILCLEELLTGDYMAILVCDCNYKIHLVCYEQHKEYSDECMVCRKKITPWDAIGSLMRSVFGVLRVVFGE